MRLSTQCVLVALIQCSCASYRGNGLEPGISRVEDVERVMGVAAMRWQAPDRSLRLAYPRGPMGFDTFMVDLAVDGRLLRIENVLSTSGFAKIRAGMTKDQVLFELGPSDAGATQYFSRRDELVWDWRYCDDWAMPARFYVLFDGTSGIVRSTMSQIETAAGFGDKAGACGR